RGRDARDDTILTASPVVLELLQYLRARLGVPACAPLRRRAPGRADASVILEHPLHPFAPRSFAGDGSHAIEWVSSAAALASTAGQRKPAGPLVAEPGLRARCGEIAAGSASPAASAVLPDEITLDVLRSALADPVAFWLRHRLGIALPRAEPLAEGLEPMWSDERRDRGLLDSSARDLLAGEGLPRLEAVLRAAPATAGGVVGQRQARGLMERAARLVTRAGGAEASAQLVDVCLGLGGGRTLLARLPLPGADGRQRIVSGYSLNLHGLLEAWLRHAVMAAWQASAPGSRDGGAAQLVGAAQRDGAGVPLAETLLVAPDALAVVRIADPHAALRHALESAARILEAPPVAFPRAWLAAWRDSRQGGPLAELVKAGDP
ncbi:MAG: hypothetical protein ACLGHY_12410, partial [Gammaproteobacteria bacterium]